MITIYLYTLVSVLVVSIISLIGVFTLSLKERVLHRIIFILVSLAVGGLLGDAFIQLIPEAFDSGSNNALVSVLIIAGILLFFIIEKFLHWHHHHGGGKKECHKEMRKPLPTDTSSKIHPMGYMILFSDGFHNFLDGIIIGVSYLVSIEVGIATTLAIILHEIPQEVGDFGILLHAGFSKAKALFFNFLSALLAVIGAIVALAIGATAGNFVELVLPIAAGGFIYIACSDLIPELQKTKKMSRSLLQFAAIIAGVVAMYLLLFI